MRADCYANPTLVRSSDPNFDLDCGAAPGCLFHVALDPSERVDLAKNSPNASMQAKGAALAARLAVLKRGFWQNAEKGVDACPPNTTRKGYPCACWMAANVYNGFLGPYQGVPLHPTWD